MILFKIDITAFNLGSYEARTITVNCENSGQEVQEIWEYERKKTEQRCGRNT